MFWLILLGVIVYVSVSGGRSRSPVQESVSVAPIAPEVYDKSEAEYKAPIQSADNGYSAPDSVAVSVSSEPALLLPDIQPEKPTIRTDAAPEVAPRRRLPMNWKLPVQQ